MHKTDTKKSKNVKRDNICYRKVGRAITKLGAIEKGPIVISQYCKNKELDSTIVISHFKGTNIIFAYCSF